MRQFSATAQMTLLFLPPERARLLGNQRKLLGDKHSYLDAQHLAHVAMI